MIILTSDKPCFWGEQKAGRQHGKANYSCNFHCKFVEGKTKLPQWLNTQMNLFASLMRKLTAVRPSLNGSVTGTAHVVIIFFY